MTYKQAANVQPFANTLVNMDLTGAQIKATLEQQWQAPGAARPFLKLGMSKGFEYTYDPSKAQGNRIQKMWLNGVEINPATVYSVTVNSFLATGGDGFTALNGGTGKQDTGKSDLQAQVDYFKEFANAAEGDAPLPVDYQQQAVGVKLPAAAPTSYAIGDHVAFDLSSLSMTDPLDVRDAEVAVELGRLRPRHVPRHHDAERPGQRQQQRRGRHGLGRRGPAAVQPDRCGNAHRDRHGDGHRGRGADHGHGHR